MSILEETFALTGIPIPELLYRLKPEEQQQISAYIKSVVEKKTEGFEELYEAIGMIVKYIPNFIVIPLMVEHIRPQIAAGVCRKMGIDQATGYANDLPTEYFSKVSRHLGDDTMAKIFEHMKRSQAERVISYEAEHYPAHLEKIAEHMTEPLRSVVARHGLVDTPVKGT